MSGSPPTHAERLPPPILVEDERGLEACLAQLEACPEVAVDTEADSFFHYQERVCLIQLSGGSRDYVVDPLRGMALEGFGRLLADPGRIKVFHDGEYDVLLLKREFGFRFASIFDTRVAAAALGAESPGLASVLEQRFNVRLDKSLQRSDWSARPLSVSQIDYARLDTHFLVPLMHEQLQELEERGRLVVVEGECRRLEELEPPPRSFSPDEFLRLKGARALDRRQMSRLRELFVMRDTLARERDVPPFKVLGNNELLRLAERGPRTSGELRSIEGLSARIVHRAGDAILAALARAEQAGPLKWMPQLPSRDGTGELDEAGVELHDRLKAWRKDRAQAEGMDASLILNRKALLDLARRRPQDAREVAGVDSVAPWQAERFGDEILTVLLRFERELASGEINLRRRRR